jgi:hypothetical protein
MPVLKYIRRKLGFHEHEVCRSGWVQYFTFIERCECGAMRMNHKKGDRPGWFMP